MRSKLNLVILSLLTLLLFVLTGCTAGGTGPEDDAGEGGVIGTGIILKGTVTDVRLFASNTLLIKSRSGEVSRAVIDEAGRYRAPNISGSPPYLLRADLGNDEFRYGIAFDNEIANVHSYTDVIMRNWFASGNGDIDFEFEQQTFTTTLPSRSQFSKNADVFFSFVRLVLDSYDLTGQQLLTGDYDANNNNNGIHTFLRTNPIFIQDKKIALVITDPGSQMQSTTRSEFSVFELATDNDNEPPAEPDSVRALPSAMDEIVLVWEPASDNKGVVGYDVYREGELIATTPFPVFVDSGLEPDLLYTYEVVSIDASNNRSAPSLPTTSGTLGEPDMKAPPAPVQLSVVPNVGRMELLWGQSEIGDVVGFDIYRGRDNEVVGFLTTVTSSVHSDVTVESGVDYCYQIVALDAAGNESPKSTEVCEKSVGNVVMRLSNEPAPQVPQLAGLNIPDVENMVCEDELESYSISTSVSVEAGCYLVDQSINVINGGNFRLLPGVVLKFGAGTRITVGEGGSFTSEGTKAAPVVLTATDPTPGYWDGVDFLRSNSSRNKLVNTVVEYGGGGSEAAVISLRAQSELSRVDISSSVIRHCLGTGILASAKGAILSRLDGSIISDCYVPLSIDVNGLKGVTVRNSYLGNRQDWIDIGVAHVDSDTRLDDLGVPYAVTDMKVTNASLNLGAGVVLKFRESGELLVEGSLTAEGTETNAVSFTGTTQERGHWKGIRVTGKVQLYYSEILFGGSHRNNSWAAAVYLIAGTAVFDTVVVSNSASYALMLENKSEITSLREVRIKNNGKAIRTPLTKLTGMGTAIEFENNDISEIELTGGVNLQADVVIHDLGIPFYLTENVNLIGGKLVIHEGVQFYISDSVEVQIRGNTALLLIGTETSPILLSSKSAIAGAWNSIKIESNNTSNLVRHAAIEFGGGEASSLAATIQLSCRFLAQLYIEHSIFRDSAGYGISVDRNTGCGLEIGENVSFLRNSKGDVFIP